MRTVDINDSELQKLYATVGRWRVLNRLRLGSHEIRALIITLRRVLFTESFASVPFYCKFPYGCILLYSNLVSYINFVNYSEISLCINRGPSYHHEHPQYSREYREELYSHVTKGRSRPGQHHPPSQQQREPAVNIPSGYKVGRFTALSRVKNRISRTSV